MSMQTKIYLVILGMWAANYLPRMLPMVVLSKLKIPQPVIWWLGFVPAAVLGAILAPSILMPDKTLFISWHNNYLAAAVPALLVAVKTRSLGWTLLAGMLAMALLQY